MSGLDIVTLGCRLNIAESEAIRAALPGAAGLVVVNSCAVTAEAVAETRKAIRRARRARPDARLLVTGCAARIDPASFAAMPEVDGLVDNLHKTEAAAYPLPAAGPHAAAAPPPAHSRAHIPVQTGCDHDCTFCIIPAGRGASRSLPAGAVIDAIAAAVDGGAREVVLTGVDITSYGHDLPGRPGLGLLVERILAREPRLGRLRLSSLDSIEIDARLFALATQEPRVMPHLHLSLQAGDDMILKRMKRRHSRAQAVAIVDRLKTARPEIAIGADLIAGFPTETPAMAANSLALIDDCQIVFGHVFPYSPRPGTPAARMPQLDRATVKARAAALRAAAARRRAGWQAALLGSVQPVLLERDGRHGHAANFARVRLEEAHAGPPRTILPVRITAADGDILTGIPA